MKSSNLLKSIAGGTLLLAVLALALGLNPSRTGSSEVQASLDDTRSARPARLPIMTEADAPHLSLGSIRGTATRAVVREPGALHRIEPRER